MESVTFDLPVAKDFQNIQIFTTGQLTDTCLKKQWILTDTAVFKNMFL